MNERIKELSEQADNYAKETVHYYNGVFHALTWKQKFEQVRDTKFAELIVDECTNVFKQNWTTGGSSRPISAAKKHFGVEEPKPSSSMRYFSYNSFWIDPLGNHVDKVETFSEDEIKRDYYPYWYGKMCKKYGKGHVDLKYSFEECLIDWIHLHWAWEVKE